MTQTCQRNLEASKNQPLQQQKNLEVAVNGEANNGSGFLFTVSRQVAKNGFLPLSPVNKTDGM